MNVIDYVGDAEKTGKAVIVRERINRDDFSLTIVGDKPFNQRANIKIQDGCDFHCSFCIIPFARGHARSRDFDNLLKEAKHLASRGVREFVLTGVNIGTFANSGKNIIDIVDSLNAIDSCIRIRISSIEPTTIPEELFTRMADPRHALLPFFHIPLQSGSDKILSDMQRKYTVSEYENFIRNTHNAIPDLCIGTDILVGFPGETNEDFEETCRVFLENPFAFCHVFTYSERDMTPAKKRTDQVPVPERQKRSARLRSLSASKKHDFYESHLGREMDVLFENPQEGKWPGYTQNYIRVVAKDKRDLTNKLVKVKLKHIAADYVEGDVVSVLG